MPKFHLDQISAISCDLNLIKPGVRLEWEKNSRPEEENYFQLWVSEQSQKL